VDKQVNPPVTYPGNKAKLAPYIIRHIPKHDTYVEVFGGTAGVLFNKKPSRNEVINDADADLHTFLSVLKQRPGELQEWLRARPYSEHLYDDLRAKWHTGWRPDDDVAAAGVYFFLRRGSFGGDLGGFRATADGRRFAPRQYSHAIDRLDKLSRRLQDVLLLNRDFEAVIKKYASSTDAFLYMDPPYRRELHHYKNGLFDRGRFCALLAKMSGGDIYDRGETRADWLLSCARVPLSIRDLYWEVETDCIHEINNGGGAKEVTERLVANYDLEHCERFHGEGQAGLTQYTSES